MLYLGIGFAFLFWILESAIHAYIFPHQGKNLLLEIFRPNAHEAWMRLIVVVMFIAFAFYAQKIISYRLRAEEQAKRAHGELKQIFNTAADGMCVIDINFNILRANDTFCHFFGCLEKDIAGRKCYEAITCLLCNTQACPMIRIMSGEGRVECEVEKNRTDGGIMPCILIATPFTGLKGELLGIVEDFKDITETKRSHDALRRAHTSLEEVVNERTSDLVKANKVLKQEIQLRTQMGDALRESEASLAEAQRIARLGSWNWDIQKNQFHWSEQAYRVFGFTPEQSGATYDAFMNFVYTDDKGLVEQCIKDALYHKTPYRLDHRIVLPDGSVRFVHQQAEVMYDNNGNPMRMIGTVQDITRRKHVEEQIERSEMMLKAVFDGLSEPLMMLDKDFSVRMLNKPALAYYGITADSISHKPCYKVFQGRHNPCEGCRIIPAIQEGRFFTFERRGLINPERLEKVVVYPIDDHAKAAGGAIIRISDITQTKVMEEQLTQSAKLSTVGLLSSGIAHEINNPMAIINEKAGLMKDLLEASKDEFKYRDRFVEMLSSIVRSVDRCRMITRRLLRFSKPTVFETITIDLNQFLEETLGFVQMVAWHRGINIDLDLAPDLPSIESDGSLLQQVFVNIINNAFEAVEENEGKIAVSSRLKAQDTIQVSIRDNGCGMASEDIRHIFEPFYSKNKETGTGLGLFITHTIVKNLGGRIGVESEKGKGTTITVDLPIKGPITGDALIEAS
ncbi:MAG: PAS domain S-box protein [Pseudomonadota bacterium]